ncbi:hypothetical protein FNV43_RR26114 [Rhamnella rubrinervis]|uniref:glutathione transferase n=1 Tax=Rhamnella rubrinervis TaxID=2594499 RepID=A0A8K0GNZ3_9ROSA|nr:hypothetical protein FNV43_RR26114 [Rhamnella rubrinervis]
MGESSEVKVVGAWTSPFVMRPRIALNIKNVNYSFVEENLAKKSELLLKSNPVYKKVPVLIHGDKPICESLVIVEYIDEAWSSGPSILPSDPYDRATAHFWATYINEKWPPAAQAIGLAKGEEAKKAAVESARAILAVMEGGFKQCSKGKAFFGGDRIGYVDIAFGSFLAWIRAREIVLDCKLLEPAHTPELVKWEVRFRQDPAVVGVMTDTDKLVEFAWSIIDKIRNVPTHLPK